MGTDTVVQIQRSRPLAVAFYSFKGGVGRTFTLVNVAFSLARRGKNVVLLDMDLEAPGLDAFPTLRPPRPIPGFLEFLESYLASGTLPSLTDYFHKVADQPGHGKIWVMYAGIFDETYAGRLGRTDWNTFYADKDGYNFFEALKDNIAIELQPDYILIDSRTGYSDTAGIALIHLPDVVVLFYGLDEQNLRGASKTAHIIRHNPLEKRIKIIPVAARVPSTPDYFQLQIGRFAEAEKLGIAPIVVIPSEPSLAFGETILVPNLEEPMKVSGPVYLRIEELTNHIIQTKVDDIDNILMKARAALEEGNAERVWDLYSQAIRAFPSAQAWAQFGRLLLTTRKYEEAREAFNIARRMEPYWAPPAIALAKVSQAQGQTAEALRYLKEYLSLGGKNHRELIAFATVLYESNDFDHAEEIYRLCVLAQDTSLQVEAWHPIARILLARNQPNEALSVLDNIRQIQPLIHRDIVWQYNYAETLSRIGDEGAKEAFTAFLELAEPLIDSNLERGGPIGANFLQATAHALANAANSDTANHDRARYLYRKAIEIAKEVPKDTKEAQKDLRIFSTVTYRHETREEFITQTQELMLRDLKEVRGTPH